MGIYWWNEKTNEEKKKTYTNTHSSRIITNPKEKSNIKIEIYNR